jgi:hypothetical protein
LNLHGLKYLHFKFHKSPLANNEILGSKVLAETPCIYFNFKGKKRKRDIEENSKEKGNKTKLKTRKIEISMGLPLSAYTVDIELNEYN